MAEYRELPLPPEYVARSGRRTGKGSHPFASYPGRNKLAVAAAKLFGPAPAPAPQAPPCLSESVRLLGDFASDLMRHPEASPAHTLGLLLYQCGGACWAASATGDAGRVDALLAAVKAHNATADRGAA